MTYINIDCKSFIARILPVVGVTVAFVLMGGMHPAGAQQKQVKRLKRGLVATNTGDGFVLSWRLLGDEAHDIGFNVYRGSQKLNSSPITGTTQYLDEGVSNPDPYTVRAVVDGEEQPASDTARVIGQTQGSNAAYFDVPLNRPAVGEHGGSYSPNDLSVGDLTGNGEYEVVVKWNPSNAKDNAQTGITDDVYLDAYTLDGTMLWRINLGPNIRAGAHYTQFMVYDFDSNGQAELMVKTAPGTKDGTGEYLQAGPAADADHGAVYRNDEGYILEGPEYLTVFDGATGEEIDTENYRPPRGNVSDWGDDYGNRVDRFLAGVAYLDGEHPSAVFARGYYTRMVVVSWDLNDGELTHRWTFDTDDPEYGNSWTGQGNHQLSVVDADGDSRHEIVYGSVVIDDDGSGLHTTGLGHGDALHATYMEKDADRPYVFMPHEWDVPGVTLRDAESGAMIFRKDQSGDVGRGVAAPLDNDHPGFQFWAASGMGLYDIDGNVIGDIPSSINHVVWWDGQLSRELLNQNRITKWDIDSNSGTRLLTAEGASSINGTKANPNLQADLFGDWREEVIFRTSDNEALRVFTTTMTTSHRLYTFMHDPVYRVAVAWQNSGYNQPPHPGFYVAGNMDLPPPQPNVAPLDTEFSDCQPSPLTPNLAVGEGEMQQDSGIQVEEGQNVTLSPETNDEGTWSWTGPDDFSSSAREVTIENFGANQNGNYIVTFTNSCGTLSRLSFSLSLLDNDWSFDDGTMQGWSVNSNLGAGSVVSTFSYNGSYSLELSGITGSSEAYLDLFSPRSASAVDTSDWVNFRVYIPESQIESIQDLGVYHRHGADWESDDHVWEENTVSTDDLEAGTWVTLSDRLADSFNADNLLVMGLVLRQNSESATPSIFVDNITYSDDEPTREPSTPSEIALRSNYPNPFASTTQIPFELDEPVDVTIELFDILGRRVRVLVDARRYEAGSYTLPFEATRLSSGVYIYRMQAGDFRETRKLSVVK